LPNPEDSMLVFMLKLTVVCRCFDDKFIRSIYAGLCRLYNST